MLNQIVVSTGSCQTVRPWNDNSIALRFVDQGAAAYAGFVYSPNEGYLIGEFDGLPFRYTWPGFPIGHVIQAQNRGTLQGFARFPYLFLLGDPRIAFQSYPPYSLVDDRLEDGQRILKFQQVPSGVIPVRITGGATYRFVEAEGITTAAEQDPFYNSRLQMVDIQEDKYILLVHPGGDLTLRLRPQAPWHWFLRDILLDLFRLYLHLQPAIGGGHPRSRIRRHSSPVGGEADSEEADQRAEAAPRPGAGCRRGHPPDGLCAGPAG